MYMYMYILAMKCAYVPYTYNPMLKTTQRVSFAGNKIDIPVAASEDELRHSLGLYTHMTSGGTQNLQDVKKM